MPDKETEKKMLVVFFYGQLSNIASETMRFLDDKYHITLYNLSLSVISDDKNVRKNFINYISGEINKYYERHLCNAEDVVFVSDSIIMVPFLTWLHDFSPRHRAAIVFSCKTERCRFHSNDLKKISDECSTITRPVLLILAKGDSPGRAFMGAIANSNVKSITLEESIETCTFYNKVKRFIEDSPDKHFYTPSFINADKNGFTYDEKVRLEAPEKNFFKNAYWKVNRALLQAAGSLSSGIKTGLEQGFDSGSMLDYIYKNTPHGKGALGVFIDRLYLNSTSWQGVRYRERYVNDYLSKTIRHLRGENRKINVVDIAAGHAKYLFDLDNSTFEIIDDVILRDYDKVNCQFGNDMIRSRRLSSKIVYEEGDAFSPQDLTSLPTDRTIAVASGFYELFGNNELVMGSLKGIYNSLEEDGVFIYTNILIHPRHAYMARVMSRHHDKASWLIRRRFQQELDELVHAVGFTKMSQRVDPWGIFSVSLARKCVSHLSQA